jgi:hypothetical protein
MKRLFRFLRWLLVVFGLAIVSARVVHLALRPSPNLVDAEQYAVLSAYVEPNLTGDSHDLGSREGVVVIAAKTTFSLSMVNSNKFRQYRSLVLSTSYAKATIQQLNRSLVFEFWAANLRDLTLERRFRLPARYELATEEEMQLYPQSAFFERFPRSYGALTFSRVAFNRDLTEAFFYTEHLCGLCGEGKFVYMQKTAGKWVVAGTASTWISERGPATVESPDFAQF